MPEYDAEIERTAVQRKVVSKLPAEQVLNLARTFFEARGYRTGKTGRPGQIFVLGKTEGTLPRVTAEIGARADVGKPGTTLVAINGIGERLGPALTEFVTELRRRRGKEAGTESGKRPIDDGSAAP